MKKIIIIIFLLITAKGFCQFEPIPKANGNKNPLNQNWISVSDGDTIKTAGRTYFYNSGTSKVYTLPTGDFPPKSEFYLITKTCTSPGIEFISGTTFSGAGAVVLENNGVIHFMISEAGDKWIIISSQPQP